MYRLLKIKNLHLFNSYALFSTTHTNKPKVLTCCSCKHTFFPIPKSLEVPHSTTSLRHQSTNVSNVMSKNATTKKKKIKRKKKYAELLEITDISSSQTKASVSKLKAKHLSLLAEQPDINLAQLHHLKKLQVSPSNKTTSSIGNKIVLPTTRTSNLLDKAVAEAIRELANSDKNFKIKCPSHSAASIDISQGALCSMTALEPGNNITLFSNNALQKEHLEYEDDEHGVELDLTESLKPVVEGKHSLTLDEYIETLEEDQSNRKLTDLADEELEDSISPDCIMPTVTSKSKKGKKVSYPVGYKYKKSLVKIHESDRAFEAERAALIQTLQSYIDVCVSCDMLNMALSTLKFYSTKNKSKRKLFPVNVKVYETLLHGFAGKSNLSRVKEIFQMLELDDISPSAQCFAACFECIGRMPVTDDTTDFLESCFFKMDQQDVSLNDLIANCSFVMDQREKVLCAIRRIKSDFEPVLPFPDTCYSCTLLHHLNAENYSTLLSGYSCPGRGIFSNKDMKIAVEKQFRAEVEGYVRVKSIDKQVEPDETVLHFRNKLKESEEKWRQVVSDALKRDIAAMKAQNSRNHMTPYINLYPYIRCLDVEQYCEIVLQEIRKLAEGSETYSPSMNYLYRSLGYHVQSRYQVQYKGRAGILKKIRRLYEKYSTWYLDPPLDDNIHNTREKFQRLLYENPEGPSVENQDKSWPNSVLLQIGKFLYNIILRDVKIDVNLTRITSKSQHFLPAFYTIYRHKSHVIKEEIKPHPVLARLYRSANQRELSFDVSLVPMLVPPIPWISLTTGGYLLAKADIIRMPYQAVQQWNRLKESPLQQLYPVLDSLNQLGAVPWTVNEPVLDVLIEVFNSGGSHKLDIPEPVSSCPVPEPLTPSMNKEERYAAFRKKIALRRCKAEMYSLWCDALYRLSLANHFRKTIFWLPHNLDFRGRVYPLPPHLSHLGSDMARAMLCFARGKPLGKRGLDWLKIHVVNLTGLKKKDSVNERLKYANEILPEILDSADNPLTGYMWWAKSEEPWQTLAGCMEIARAIRSGDPENYLCHFPVHQDGSCNGLQHYAALGRDLAGAKSVNLVPAKRPQDVYSCVAVLVEQERQKDAETGLQVAQILEGFVQRKVVKQTIMTTVYGVTRFGARLQIAKQLKDLDDFPKEYVWQASSYLVKKTFESLQEMFTSTKLIQDWFVNCARQISQVCGENVEWVTPLGLPVVQPYIRYVKRSESHQDGKFYENNSMDMYELPNTVKQRNAFPPNYIHCLDSCHMMLTSLHCEREGITFVSVHDCFWTHPSTVNIMNKVCREQFVALHSQPLLEDLSKFLVNKYSYSLSEFNNDDSSVDRVKHIVNRTLEAVPPKGDLDIKIVLKSVYFFS